MDRSRCSRVLRARSRGPRPDIDEPKGRRTTSGPLLAILLSTVGPVALFAEGIGAWPVVAVVLALITICLGLARLARWKSPGTEWFAFWLLCAALSWAGFSLATRRVRDLGQNHVASSAPGQRITRRYWR